MEYYTGIQSLDIFKVILLSNTLYNSRSDIFSR